jgi:hypothetical protein
VVKRYILSPAASWGGTKLIKPLNILIQVCVSFLLSPAARAGNIKYNGQISVRYYTSLLVAGKDKIVAD